MFDPRVHKLGRRPPIPGLKVPRLSDHWLRPAAPPPLTCKRSNLLQSWGMHLNGQNATPGVETGLDDCTIAAAANAVQTWTAANGAVWPVSDAVVLGRYAVVSGYKLGDPSTDTGAIETDVLGMWSRQGWDIGRQDEDVTLWAALQPGNEADVREVIYHFGGVYVGLLLPDSAQNQAVWDVGSEPGTWASHAVWVTDYDPDGLACITWDTVQRMTWAFWNRYCEEAYALLNRDWLGTLGISPEHLDFNRLQGALDAIAA
jgi:hypothetical protein